MKRSTLLLLALLGVVGFSTGCQGKKGRSSGGMRPVEVVRGDLEMTVLSTGTVQPQNQLNIKPPISGRIEKIFIHEGAFVKKGQLLMELSSTERAALLDTAQAQGPEALAHWEDLYKATPLLSPQSGQIVYLPTVTGQVVSLSDTLMVMSNHLIVNTQVDETDLAQVKMNQDVVVTLDAYPGQPIDAKVRRISYQSTLVNNVTTYQVDVWPNKVPSFMRSGMTANVVFKVSEKNDVLLIPSEAVQQRDGQSTVLVAAPTPTDKPKNQPIQTGITDGKQIEVVSGLKEGDRVMVRTFSAAQAAPASNGTNPFAPSRPTGRTGGGSGGGGGNRGH
jgi:macrolide-specific efflux system membrane fusion protein